MYGPEAELYDKKYECAKKLAEEGYKIAPDYINTWCCIERYGYPRFIEPDEKGNVILDICFFVE